MNPPRPALLVGRGVIHRDAARALAAVWALRVYGTHSFSTPLQPAGESHWWSYMAFATAVALETALIVALLVERRQRRAR